MFGNSIMMSNVSISVISIIYVSNFETDDMYDYMYKLERIFMQQVDLKSASNFKYFLQKKS